MSVIFWFGLLGIGAIGFFVGVYVERVRWNGLIERGVLPAPGFTGAKR